MAEFTESADGAGIEALEVAVAKDPGGEQFAVLAEAYRRAGRHGDARRVAVAGLALRPDDTAGRLALGLTLLDLGEPAAARYELERAMGTVTDHPFIASGPSRDSDATFAGDIPVAPANEGLAENDIGDDELEAAFADAESVAEEMLDANQIAAQAMVQSELDEPEGFALEEAEAFEPAEESFELGEVRAFATETMARLLAEQGDPQGAEAIRARLVVRQPVDAAIVPDEAYSTEMTETIETSGAHSERSRIIATLETWLVNLQRNRS